jgi:hypothetical protein
MIVFGKNEYVYGSLNAWRYLYVNGWNCLILGSVGINILVGTATIWWTIYKLTEFLYDVNSHKCATASERPVDG